jgi:hypothetical protein
MTLFGLGLPFGYVLGVTLLADVVGWLVRRRRQLAPGRLLDATLWPPFTLHGTERWCRRQHVVLNTSR